MAFGPRIVSGRLRNRVGILPSASRATGGVLLASAEVVSFLSLFRFICPSHFEMRPTLPLFHFRRLEPDNCGAFPEKICRPGGEFVACGH